MPRFSYLFSEDNKSEIKKLSRQFLNVTFLISVPCCCGIILVADQIVEVLFGVEFLPAISTIRILSILIVLMPLSGGVFCQLLLTAGKEKSYLACVLIGTVVNAVLNYLLIPTFTQNGAAIASVVAEFTVSILVGLPTVSRVKPMRIRIFSISIELLQLLLRLGTFQLSDIFYNTVGGVLGGLMYCAVMKARKRL